MSNLARDRWNKILLDRAKAMPVKKKRLTPQDEKGVARVQAYNKNSGTLVNLTSKEFQEQKKAGIVISTASAEYRQKVGKL